MSELLPPKVEKYKVKDKEVYVVRDDLGTPFPAPNNSKIRGLSLILQKLKEDGIKTVASQDTRISRIGWGVSYLCKHMDLIHYNFYPEHPKIPFYQKMSAHFGGKIIPLHGTFSSGFRAMAKRWLAKNQIEAYFLPIGMSSEESVYATSLALCELDLNILGGSIVVSISSGTIATGVAYGCLRANHRTKIYGVLSSSFGNRMNKIQRLLSSTEQKYSEILYHKHNLELINLKYKYRQQEPLAPPFPCDLYLDRKAWKFLVDNVEKLPEPIVFWNIGGEWNPIDGLSKGLRGDGLTTEAKVKPFLEHEIEVEKESIPNYWRGFT